MILLYDIGNNYYLHHLQKRLNHTIYLAISRKVTTRHDATTPGITLGCHPDDIMYYIDKLDVRDAAYRFLYWAEDKHPVEEKWQKIIATLTILENVEY